MADPSDEKNDDDLDLQPAEAGVMFKAEMWATNAILGYWPYLLGGLIVVLLGILFVGQYSSYVVRTERAGSAQVAEVTARLDVPLPLLGIRKAADQLDLSDEQLIELGDGLMARSAEVSGNARVEALLEASELYRVAGSQEKQRQALEQASEAATADVFRFAAEGALASLDLEEGQGDQAVDRLRRMIEAHEGFLAQQASLDLGLALEQLDRDQEALQVYEEFLRTWSDSPRIDEVNERRQRVEG